MNSATELPVSSVAPGISPRQRRLRLLGLVIVPLVLLIVGTLVYLLGGRTVETDNAYVKADKVAISAEVDGPVAKILVNENQVVSAGQLLFELDPAPFRVAETRTLAALGEVRTELMALKASYQEKRAEITVAKTRLEFAARERKRQIDLAARRFVSAAILDSAEQNETLARQQVVALEQDLQRIAESLGGDAQADIELHPRYLAAQAQLHQAQLDLSRTHVSAAINGTIVQLPKLGQYLKTGTVAAVLVASDQPWIEANFTETDLTHVQAGQSVAIQVDTYPGIKWEGVVDSLSPATGAEFSIIPAQNATGNWVKVAQRLSVRIHLNNIDDKPPLRAGLSSVVEIDTGRRRSLFGWSL